MATSTAVPVLAPPCPPHWQGMTAARITRELLDNQVRWNSILANQCRAWQMLGWPPGADRPAIGAFVRAVQNLWDFLVTRQQNRTRRARRGRAIILAALRVLGFRSPKWNVDHMYIYGESDFRHLVPWSALRQSTSQAPASFDAAIQEYRTLRAFPPTHNSIPDRGAILTAQYQRYHRYQGFHAGEELQPDDSQQLIRFRAIPVPEGPHSIWHSIA